MVTSLLWQQQQYINNSIVLSHTEFIFGYQLFLGQQALATYQIAIIMSQSIPSITIPLGIRPKLMPTPQDLTSKISWGAGFDRGREVAKIDERGLLLPTIIDSLPVFITMDYASIKG